MDVNITLASWSNLLLYSAMGVYALTFIFYAFDLFGRQRVADREANARAGKTAKNAGEKRAVNGVTVEAAATSAGRTSRKRSGVAVVDGPEESGAVVTDGDADSVGDKGKGRGQDAAASPAKGAAADDGDGTPVRRLARVATATFVISLLLHVAAIVTRGLSVMRVPWGNMMEYLMVATAIAGIVYLIVVKWRDVRYLGTFISGAILLGLGLCATVFYTPAAQLVPALQSYWIYIHVPIAILSTALLSISAALAVFQMLKAFVESRKASDSKQVPRFLRWMDRGWIPASAGIEQASYRIAAVGFITWTFTLIAGAIWAEVAWSRYWGWDSKEIWTFVVWVVYAAYLHSRATRGWSTNKVAVLNLVGFLCIIFNFTIVNTYFNGLHSYSGL